MDLKIEIFLATKLMFASLFCREGKIDLSKLLVDGTFFLCTRRRKGG